MSIKFIPSLKSIPESRVTSLPDTKNGPISAQRRAELDKEVAAMFNDYQKSWKDDLDRKKKMSELGKK